jgi:hypothetical protein
MNEKCIATLSRAKQANICERQLVMKRNLDIISRLEKGEQIV